MPRDESFYPAAWLRIAGKDLARVEHLLRLQDAEAAGFYLQQAVEKFLKAFLLFNGWKLERIHDLEVLLNAALVYDPSLERFRAACQKITSFYVLERYPLVADVALTTEDVAESRQQVRELTEKLRAEVAS